jgi:hypothetical protein
MVGLAGFSPATFPLGAGARYVELQTDESTSRRSCTLTTSSEDLHAVCYISEAFNGVTGR